VQRIGVSLSNAAKTNSDNNDDNNNNMAFPSDAEFQAMDMMKIEEMLHDFVDSANDRHRQALGNIPAQNYYSTSGSTKHKKLKSSVIHKLLEIVSNLRSLVYDSNILLEAALRTKTTIANLNSELNNTIILFNNYWNQCGAIILSDPSVHMAKALAINNSIKNNLNRNTVQAAEMRAMEDMLAEEMINKKHVMVDILYNDGHLPGDDLSVPLPANRFGSEVFIRWWIRMHCETLPTMQPVGVEYGFCDGATFNQITHAAIVASESAARGGGGGGGGGAQQKQRHDQQFIAAGQTFAFRPSANNLASKKIERPSRKSSLIERLKFWYARVNAEGVKAVLQDPWAGFRPGIGEMMFLPTVSLKDGDVRAETNNIMACVHLMVDQGMFVHQLKTIKALDMIQKKARFFVSTGVFNNDTQAIHDFFAADEALLEQTLSLAKQWSESTACERNLGDTLPSQG
jgi:hypothetical protein